MSPQYVWKNTANPTSMNTGANVLEKHVESPSNIRNIQRLSPELLGLVLSHMDGDIATLKVCSLVCPTWASQARRVLFREVVVRPAMPSRTWTDFFQLLSASPEVARYIRRLMLCGHDPKGEQRQVQTGHLSEALERLPSLTELFTKNGMFASFRRNSKGVSGTGMTALSAPERPLQLRLLSLENCEVRDFAPLHQLFTHLGKVETLVLHQIKVDVCHLDLPSPLAEILMRHQAMVGAIQPALPPPLAVRVGTIQTDRVRAPVSSIQSLQGFYQFLRRSFSPPAAGLSVSTRLVDGPGELLKMLNTFDRDVRSVSINVLLGSCDPDDIVVGTVESKYHYLPYFSFASHTSIRELVLYFTTTSVMAGRHAVDLYKRILANNWSVLSNAPTSLTHIELRFQRCGLHMRYVLDDLRVLYGPGADPGEVGWRTVDEGTLQRFPRLEAFTCVLCDEGFFANQSMPFEDAETVAQVLGSSVRRRQQEFDDYAALLQGLLPRLHERGLLRFRMSEAQG
ncbi:hypothetical protein L226DRAFT_616361 [Lentinus tigrinus ALCF2SS1-7]|uniref:F-box domain-containing protein n=1 Tax=Lentinus tigrinus ALCF2SS1-6 TaxID=1328759 RepID=A0A5C2RVF6_9APHY|nr:hypothetical protein L227DRAFT_603649 [Lentinus tigrinus ALCF2SS1-6]RPD70121.1 hypothetical protein L226DRAFT_616361 [Lentinus tigrinus ALCF2SS1-7]